MLKILLSDRPCGNKLSYDNQFVLLDKEIDTGQDMVVADAFGL